MEIDILYNGIQEKTDLKRMSSIAISNLKTIDDMNNHRRLINDIVKKAVSIEFSMSSKIKKEFKKRDRNGYERNELIFYNSLDEGSGNRTRYGINGSYNLAKKGYYERGMSTLDIREFNSFYSTLLAPKNLFKYTRKEFKQMFPVLLDALKDISDGNEPTYFEHDISLTEEEKSVLGIKFKPILALEGSDRVSITDRTTTKSTYWLTLIGATSIYNVTTEQYIMGTILARNKSQVFSSLDAWKDEVNKKHMKYVSEKERVEELLAPWLMLEKI